MDNSTLKLKEKIFQSLKSNKKDFIERYGKDAEKVMYGMSFNIAKNKVEKAVQEYLSNPISLENRINKIDKLIENNWDDPYMKDNDIWDYEPNYEEIKAFTRDEKGLSSKKTPPKYKYTGKAELQVKMGFNKWETIKTDSIKLIKYIYNNLPNKSDYRIRYEIK